MSAAQAITAVGGAIAGWLCAAIAFRHRVRNPIVKLARVNVDGRSVAAILGESLSVGALAGVGVAAIVGLVVHDAPGTVRVALATSVVTVVLLAAGRFDDLRGDELPRGFKGHLAAARGGRLTGGLVKIAAGVGAGTVAGLAVSSGRGVVETALLVALSANLVNLLDRAPGRAAKVGLAAGLPLLVFGSPAWGVESAGLLGALLFCLPHDLRARGMLGDAGANPLGGVLGLGLAVSLGETGRLVGIAVLLLLNALSERFSFSRAIEGARPLKWLDMLGRK